METRTDFPAPAGYTPVHPKDHGMRLNPDSTAAHAAAFRIVLLHTLSYAFDLLEEEVLWTGFQLDRILEPLLTVKPETVPFSVRQELVDGSYTRLMELRSTSHKLAPKRLDQSVPVLQAGLSEWVDTLVEPLSIAYALSPTVEAEIRSQMTLMLEELGVDSTTNPRPATHLPAELRKRIFADRSLTN